MNKAAAFSHLGRIKISGEIEALTGIHIGGTDAGLAIGGADPTVVRNGLDGRPYIPGSSLKGKMRCLLERIYKPREPKSDGNSKIHVCQSLPAYEQCFVCHVFGITPEDVRKVKGEAMPTRLLVRDAMMTDETAEALERSLYTDMPLTQVKTEVVIDRITSAATPRQIERVPAGARFAYELVYNVFRLEDLQWLAYIKEAMDLVEEDYLGGQGSRGYGKVRFASRLIEAKSFKPGELDIEADRSFKDWAGEMKREPKRDAA